MSKGLSREERSQWWDTSPHRLVRVGGGGREWEEGRGIVHTILKCTMSLLPSFCPDSILIQDFLESGNLVRTDMDLRHTLDETVAVKMKQSSETIVVYHPT